VYYYWIFIHVRIIQEANKKFGGDYLTLNWPIKKVYHEEKFGKCANENVNVNQLQTTKRLD